MNPFDTIIAIILGYCLIRGFFRGLIKELSSIIGVLGGSMPDTLITWISQGRSATGSAIPPMSRSSDFW